MKWAVCIVSPPGYLHSEAFREVAESLHHGLTALGHDAVLTYRVGLPGRRSIVLGANLAGAAGTPLSPDAIVYNLEQIQEGSPWLDQAYLELLQHHEVWDYSAQNLARLEALGVRRLKHVPIGYAPGLTRIALATEDIDVVFVGSLNERRKAVLDALERRGVRVERLFGVYGGERDATLARAKICLNVHYYDAKVFELVRVSYLLANRRFVVSERGGDSAEEAAFAPGVAFADYDRLVETCIGFLDRSDDRRRIAVTGFGLMSERGVEKTLGPALAPLR